jgi:hypothetical protein
MRYGIAADLGDGSIRSFDKLALSLRSAEALALKAIGNLYGTIFPLPPVGNGNWPFVALTGGNPVCYR